VGGIAATEIAVAVGDSRQQRENLLGYAVEQIHQVPTVGPNFALCDDFEGRVLGNLGQYFLEGGHMLDMDL
jgi:hypothetical protein